MKSKRFEVSQRATYAIKMALSSIPILTAGIGSCTIRAFPYRLKNY